MLALLRNKKLKWLQINGSELEDYYKNINDFNFDEMLNKQIKVLKREIICVFLLTTFIMTISFLHLNVFYNYKVDQILDCSSNGFHFVLKQRSYVELIGFLFHMVLIVIVIRGFVKVFYQIPN